MPTRIATISAWAWETPLAARAVITRDHRRLATDWIPLGGLILPGAGEQSKRTTDPPVSAPTIRPARARHWNPIVTPHRTDTIDLTPPPPASLKPRHR